MADKMGHRVWAWVMSNPCFYLFAALLLLLILLPMFQNSEAGKLWFTAMNLPVLVSSVVTLGRSRVFFWVALLLAGAAFGLLVASHFEGGSGYLAWSWRFSVAVFVVTLVHLVLYHVNPFQRIHQHLELSAMVQGNIFRRNTAGQSDVHVKVYFVQSPEADSIGYNATAVGLKSYGDRSKAQCLPRRQVVKLAWCRGLERLEPSLKAGGTAVVRRAATPEERRVASESAGRKPHDWGSAPVNRG